MINRLLSIFAFIMTAITVNGQARVFNHPGSILSMEDLNRIKNHVDNGDEPWGSLWKELQADTYALSTGSGRNPASDIGGSDGTRQRASADGYQALINAIEWHITGKTKYANCAVRCLNAWGKTVETAKGQLFQYPCRTQIIAAEMLRYEDGTFYEGWAETDRNTFLDKVRNIYLPALENFCVSRTSTPSWYAGAAVGVLAAGVLLDDADIYERGLALYRDKTASGSLYGVICNSNGQVAEMGRDNVHAVLGLNDLAQMAVIAWNQGDDLFADDDNRLLKGFDYFCRYNLGYIDTPYEEYTTNGGAHWYFISTHNNAFRLRPDGSGFEAVYHHFYDIKNLSDDNYPYLTRYTKLARPDTHMENLGFGTLFFTIDANNSPYFTEVPEKATNFEAKPGYLYSELSWDHPENDDVRGFRIYRSTDKKSWNMIKEWDYYTNNRYIDYDVKPGTTYYYRVRFINKAGLGSMSGMVECIPDGGDQLPDGWAVKDLTSNNSSTLFTTAQDSTFALKGYGNGFDGNSDSGTLLYHELNGKQSSLIVRLTSTAESFHTVGIMLRNTLYATSPEVGLLLGGSGWRYCNMSYRKTTRGNVSWISGDDFTYAPTWFKIERDNNTFTTYQSRDGVKWSKVGSATVTMGNKIYACMVVASGSTSEAYEVVFDHVKIFDDETTALPEINADSEILNDTTVFTCDGKLVYSTSDKEFIINTLSIPKGIYIVKASNGRGSSRTYKEIKN